MLQACCQLRTPCFWQPYCWSCYRGSQSASMAQLALFWQHVGLPRRQSAPSTAGVATAAAAAAAAAAAIMASEAAASASTGAAAGASTLQPCPATSPASGSSTALSAACLWIHSMVAAGQQSTSCCQLHEPAACVSPCRCLQRMMMCLSHHSVQGGVHERAYNAWLESE